MVVQYFFNKFFGRIGFSVQCLHGGVIFTIYFFKSHKRPRHTSDCSVFPLKKIEKSLRVFHQVPKKLQFQKSLIL